MKGSEILARARAHLGKPYRWGATGPDTFDCFGLIEGIAREFGVPFSTEMTAAMGFSQLARTAKPRPGNVVYWRNRKGYVFHAALVESIVGGVVNTIGAHSGDSSTKTLARAKEQGACVKRKAFPLSGVAGFTVFPGQTYEGDLPKTAEREPGPSDEPPEGWV